MKHYNNNIMVNAMMVILEEQDAKKASVVVTTNNEVKPVKVKKTLDMVGLKIDQHVQIDGSELTGRAKNLNGRIAVVKEITGRGFIRVTLVNNKNGELQGCLVRMPVTALVAIEEPIQAVA